MEYRKLGKTDMLVSVLALGCWPFAGGAYWGDQDENLSIATVHAALDAGINFFDTAEA
jgi:aryl-alcohol dehydrogenase-like predicted oxidoreductase